MKIILSLKRQHLKCPIRRPQKNGLHDFLILCLINELYMQDFWTGYLHLFCISTSALTLLVGRRPAKKNKCWNVSGGDLTAALHVLRVLVGINATIHGTHHAFNIIQNTNSNRNPTLLLASECVCIALSQILYQSRRDCYSICLSITHQLPPSCVKNHPRPCPQPHSMFSWAYLFVWLPQPPK